MNPVFNILRRDLCGMPRRKRFYLKRVSLVALGGALLLWGLNMTRWSYNQAVGLEIFMPLAFCATLGMMLVAPATGSGVILREREERTLGLLFLSGLTSWEFLLGKLAVALFSSTLTILSVMPLFMLAVSLGGVAASQVVAAFVILLAAVFIGTCIGIFASSVAPSEKTTGSVLMLVGGVLYIVIPLILAMIEGLYFDRSPERELAILSPPVAMSDVVSGRLSWSLLAHVGYSLTVGVLLLWAARLAIPRRVLSRDAPPLADRWIARLKSRQWATAWIRRPPIDGNPIAWRETFFVHGGPRAAWGKFALALGTLTLMVGVSALVVADRRAVHDWNSEFATPILMVMFWVSLIVWLVANIHDFGAAFSRERRARTLDVLLTTTLTNEEIVWGKVRAALAAAVPWITGVAVAGIGLLIAQGRSLVRNADADDVAKGVFTIAAEFASMWFGYCALALWLSLRHRRNVALAVCLLLFGAWNTLGRATLLSMLSRSSAWPMVFVDVLFHGVMGAVCLSLTLRRLRETAAQTAD